MVVFHVSTFILQLQEPVVVFDIGKKYKSVKPK